MGVINLCTKLKMVRWRSISLNIKGNAYCLCNNSDSNKTYSVFFSKFASYKKKKKNLAFRRLFFVLLDATKLKIPI